MKYILKRIFELNFRKLIDLLYVKKIKNKKPKKLRQKN